MKVGTIKIEFDIIGEEGISSRDLDTLDERIRSDIDELAGDWEEFLMDQGYYVSISSPFVVVKGGSFRGRRP